MIKFFLGVARECYHSVLASRSRAVRPWRCKPLNGWVVLAITKRSKGFGDGASIDSGLACLTLLLRFQDVPIDPDQVRHQLGGRIVGTADIIRSLREYGLKARLASARW